MCLPESSTMCLSELGPKPIAILFLLIIVEVSNLQIILIFKKSCCIFEEFYRIKGNVDSGFHLIEDNSQEENGD